MSKSSRSPIRFMPSEEARDIVRLSPLEVMNKCGKSIEEIRNLQETITKITKEMKEYYSRSPFIRPFVRKRMILNVLDHLLAIANHSGSINQHLADLMVLFGETGSLFQKAGMAKGLKEAGRDDLLRQKPDLVEALAAIEGFALFQGILEQISKKHRSSKL